MSDTFREKSRARRERLRARNKVALLGSTTDETVSAGPASEILRTALEDAGLTWEDYAWDVERPEGTRVVTVDDLCQYCDTQTIEQFASSFRLPDSYATSDPDTEAKNLLAPLAKAAASKGFGTIYVPFSIDAIKSPVKVVEAIKGIAGVEPIARSKIPVPKASGDVVSVIVVKKVSGDSTVSPASGMTKNCRVCGKEFSTVFHAVIYCSEYCRQQALRQPTGARGDTHPARKSCEQCGKELPVSVSQLARFCSERCHDIYFSTHVRAVQVSPSLRRCRGCGTLLEDSTATRCPVCGTGLPLPKGALPRPGELRDRHDWSD